MRATDRSKWMGIVKKESKKDNSFIFKPDNLELAEKKTQTQRDRKAKYKPPTPMILHKPLLGNNSLSNGWSASSPLTIHCFSSTISEARDKKKSQKQNKTNKATQQTPETCSELLFIILLLRCIWWAGSSCFRDSQNALNFGILFLSSRWEMKFFMQIIALRLTVLGLCNGVADISLTS